jgi:hypothetical protein
MSLRKLSFFTLVATIAVFAAVGTLSVQIKEYEVPTPKSRPRLAPGDDGRRSAMGWPIRGRQRGALHARQQSAMHRARRNTRVRSMWTPETASPSNMRMPPIPVSGQSPIDQHVFNQ